MLGVFSNKSDHPLADVKSAQQLLEALPQTDSVVVLDEIGHWIEALFDPVNAFRLDHQCAVLRLLDEAAHTHLRKISQAYFAAQSPNAFQEARMWEAMNNYLRFGEFGYLSLLGGVRSGEKGSSGVRTHMTLVIARGIYTLFRRLECAEYKYLQADSQRWRNLADLYDYAESIACLDEPVSVYPGSGNANLTIRSMFACVIAWNSMVVGSFKPLELHIAKNLLTQMSKSFKVHKQYMPGSHFMFNLANPTAPTRVYIQGAQYPAGMRFVEILAPTAYLDNLLKTLGKNILPDELKFDVVYGVELVAETIRRIAAYFNNELPARRQQRKKIKVNVNACYGYLNILEQADEGLNIQGATSKICALEDISLNGIRFVLDSNQVNSINIGTLVGLRPDNSKNCGAGIVRRLKRDEKNNLHVGVRVLSNKTEVVLVYSEAGGHAATLALLLDYAEAQNGESWMLVPTDTFSPNTNLSMRLGNKNNLLIPIDIVEKGGDFELVRYRRLEQQSDVDV